MDERRRAIIDDSNKIISKLQLLSVFFDDGIIYKLYLRTQVIHQLFVENAELDINKLELFHLQYTQTLVELLKKIKKNNEQNVSVLLDEVQLNRDLIDKLHNPVYTKANFELEQQRQALKINNSLRKLYQVLSDDSAEYPLSKNINAFSNIFAHDFYYEIPSSIVTALTTYQPADVYKNAYAVIHKKLMGKLCKYDFRSSFYCGMRAGELILEVYKINDTEIFYSYSPAKNIFLLCDMAKINLADWPTEHNGKEGLIRELEDKNDQLKNSVSLLKEHIPPEVKNILAENYRKLNDVNFLQQISDVDVQANILKTMLNTNMM